MAYLWYLLTALITALVVLLLLVTSGRRLLRLRCEIERADKELVMHQVLSGQARNGPNESAAAQMLLTSQKLYACSARSYNQALCSPINRFPAFLLGYHPVPERNDY